MASSKGANGRPNRPEPAHGRVTEWLRCQPAKLFHGGSNPPAASTSGARAVEHARRPSLQDWVGDPGRGDVAFWMRPERWLSQDPGKKQAKGQYYRP